MNYMTETSLTIGANGRQDWLSMQTQPHDFLHEFDTHK